MFSSAAVNGLSETVSSAPEAEHIPGLRMGSSSAAPVPIKFHGLGNLRSALSNKTHTERSYLNLMAG